MPSWQCSSSSAANHSPASARLWPLPAHAAATALEETFGTRAALVRMGGSIPIVATFLSTAGVPSVLAGFGLPDDNLHAPNEKFHLPNFFAAIRFTAHFLQRYGSA